MNLVIDIMTCDERDLKKEKRKMPNMKGGAQKNDKWYADAQNGISSIWKK